MFAAVRFWNKWVYQPSALPWLLKLRGALSANGKVSPLSGVGLTVLACIIADTFWFYLGRYRGTRVLGWLCRISLEPDSCVRRTSKVFTHYGKSGLIMAKFVPGLSTLAPPLAGMSGISTIQFVTIDAFASLLYGAGLIGLGYFFSNQIEQISTAIAHIGVSSLCLLSGLAALYIAYKYWQRAKTSCVNCVRRGSPLRNSVSNWIPGKSRLSTIYARERNWNWIHPLFKALFIWISTT